MTTNKQCDVTLHPIVPKSKDTLTKLITLDRSSLVLPKLKQRTPQPWPQRLCWFQLMHRRCQQKGYHCHFNKSTYKIVSYCKSFWVIKFSINISFLLLMFWSLLILVWGWNSVADDSYGSGVIRGKILLDMWGVSQAQIKYDQKTVLQFKLSNVFLFEQNYNKRKQQTIMLIEQEWVRNQTL